MKLNLTGRVFGKLTAISQDGKDGYGRLLWKCVCACGTVVLRHTATLTTGNTKSCGCGKYSGLAENAKVKKLNGFSAHKRAHSSWRHMFDRCTNPANKDYKYYGARGISICNEWLEFSVFFADMGDPPEGMTLDRKDSNEGYCKENCRWATPKQQARNTRKNVHVTHEGRRVTVAEVSELSSVPASTIYSRLARGASPL